MIIIDGRQVDFKLSSFDNLQEVIVKVMEDGLLEERVVTDVLVDNEQFSEIYPHQAEDIACKEIKRLEIHSVPTVQMALSISEELDKVNKLLGNGAKEVAALFRQADDSEALEMFQDMLDVTRDFLGMIALLRNEYVDLELSMPEFASNAESISSLLSEMTEVLENEDWVLLSDLLEYEFLPAMENWSVVIGKLQSTLASMQQ